VDIGAGDRLLGQGKLGAVKVQGAKDALLELGGQPLAGDPLDDQAGQDVVGVAVGEPFPGREQRPMAGGDGHQLPWLEAAGWLWEVVAVVVQAAGVVEQLAHGDVVAVGDEPGQPPFQVVVQAKLVLPDQLQCHRGHKRLGHATDPEPVTSPGGAFGVQVAQAAGPLPGLLPAADQRHHPGRSSLHHPVQLALQGGRIRWRPGRGRRLDTGRGGRTVPRPHHHRCRQEQQCCHQTAGNHRHPGSPHGRLGVLRATEPTGRQPAHPHAPSLVWGERPSVSRERDVQDRSLFRWPIPSLATVSRRCSKAALDMSPLDRR
jgi:hypothetical protein